MGEVILRPWTEADAAWYAECVQDEEVQRFTTDSPTTTAEDVAKAIAGLPDNPHLEAFLIADTDGTRHGNIAVEIKDGIGEVSYLIAAESRGRGIAGRALAMFVEWISANLDVRELRLWTHVDNLPSRVVAERAGFERDPERDQVREVKGSSWPTVAYKLGGRPAPIESLVMRRRMY